MNEVKFKANLKDFDDLKNEVNRMYPTDTASGAVASFSDGAGGVPVESLIVNIDPVQEGSGDPSPENIRPISGHDEVSVMRWGKNLWHSDVVNKDGYLTKSDGVMVCAGASVSVNTTVLLGSPDAPINLKLPTGTYTLKGTSETFSGIYAELADGTTWQGTKTLPNGAVIRRIRCNSTAINNGEYYWQLQIEKGSTATDYEPYQGETYTIELGDTIYGGALDVTTGELTVDRALVDFGDLSWELLDNTLFYSSLPNARVLSQSDMICSVYPYDSSGADLKCYCINGNIFRVVDSRYNSVAAFKAALTGQEICYKLASPISITLTPRQVSTLYGTNNIFADTGNTSVTYKADIELYIQKKISAAVMTQSKDVNTAKLTVGEALHTDEDENIKPVEQTEDEIIEPIEQPEETD